MSETLKTRKTQAIYEDDYGTSTEGMIVDALLDGGIVLKIRDISGNTMSMKLSQRQLSVFSKFIEQLKS